MICGIDLSLTASGYAIWRGHLDVGTIRPPRGSSGCQRMDFVRREVVELARDAALVVMEDVAFSRNQAYAKEVAGLAWLVRVALWKAEIPYTLATATVLKKFCTGSGKAEKNLMLLQTYKRFGVEVDDDNQADALACLMLGRALVGDWEPTADFQREVVAGMRERNATVLDALLTTPEARS